MTQQLSGILTALATPFTADDRIDETLLRRLVDRSIDGGVAGVVACGSTGEFAAMSGAERRLLVETVVDQAAGRVPVVAQTGAVSTREAVELSRARRVRRSFRAHGGRAVLRAADAQLKALTYLRTVADAVSLPIMLYNLPVATGVNLSADVVGALAAEVDNIRYIKDTSADMAQAGQLIHNYGDVISTFVGWDSLLLMGLDGRVPRVRRPEPPSLSASRPPRLHPSGAAGRRSERARREWDRLYPLMNAMMSAPLIPAVNSALSALGFPYIELSQTHSRARPRDRREHRRAGDVASAAVRRAVTRTAPDYRPVSTNSWRYP